jgi:hypothetical protein
MEFTRMPSDNEYPSSRSAGDYIHVLAKAGVNFVPIIGGSAAEIIQFVIAPPLEKRREAWMNSLGKRLLELEARGINLENLHQNEQFLSAVLQATHAAMRTHQAEKLAALRNAIGNVAQGQFTDDTELHVLLSYVDNLSEMHLRVLQLCSAPKVPVQWKEDSAMHSVVEMITYNIPGLKNSDITRQLMADLINGGLIIMVFNGIPFNELTQKHSTPLGDRLLRMITA